MRHRHLDQARYLGLTMIVYDGYATGYSQDKVRQKAKLAAAAISSMAQAVNADCVIVHGNSGVSCGFAALMYHNFNLVLLRKDNDNSHGPPLEGPNGHRIERYLILDDFISSGETVRRVRRKVTELALQRSAGMDLPQCVGIVLYGSRRMEEFVFEDGHRVPVRANNG